MSQSKPKPKTKTRTKTKKRSVAKKKSDTKARPSKNVFEEKRKERKLAQAVLRARKEQQGFSPPVSTTSSNAMSEYQTKEEERAARADAVQSQIKVYRGQLPVLLKRFSKIPDPRNPKKVTHKLTVLIVYGMLCFAFQMKSRRQANREMTMPMFRDNLFELFPELESIPHCDTLFDLLEQLGASQIEEAHIAMLQKLIRNKKFKRYLVQNCYPIAIGGTPKFTRDEPWSSEPLERKVNSKNEAEGKRYYAYVLEANLSFHNGMCIPLMSEILEYDKGDQQNNEQDCEMRAFHRIADRLKRCFSHLGILLLLDGLYANGPIFEVCRRNNWDFMIVLKDDSLPSVWEEAEGLKRFQPNNIHPRKWGGREQHFWWVNDIEYSYNSPDKNRRKTETIHLVVCEESWEEIQKGSAEVVEKKSCHAWISAKPLHKNSVHKRCNLGARHRWGIESSILAEKRYGYQYESCFSLDWNAMKAAHYLMRLAHALNIFAAFSTVLQKHIYRYGYRGLIAFVFSTISAPWMTASQFETIRNQVAQLRLI